MGRRSRSSGGGDATNPPKRTRHSYGLRSVSSRAKRDKLLGGEQDGRRTIMSDEEFREKNTILNEESIGKALKVDSVDLQKEDNRRFHHSDEYEQEDLIVRRGKEFTLKVKFDRTVDADKDLVVVQFVYGSRPQESKGTLLRISINLDKKSDKLVLGWDSRVIEVKDDTLTVGITSEPDCNIGWYELHVETKLKDSTTDFTRFDADHLYMLFNPWCEDDIVFMENQDERYEYVLNDTGRIWIGSSRKNYGRPWNFGQFESPVLEVTLGLLDKGELGDSGRNSAVSIIRCLSALANSMDDEGLLEGRWTSEYPKGSTKPWEWTGSVAIVEQFHKTGKPVQYGQCWVFSAVITTLLRALGIPTRSVTNFDSAHDTDCSMTIDKHFSESGEPLDHLDDSVWNFHVWNESFFKRLDLPSGYDGWQAHDATPQESSEGVMRCGPAPLKAIKEGHVYLNFDAGFIFSEINGDKIEWKVLEDGSMEVCEIDKYSVGKCISTKAVGSSLRHDLTLDYKYRDGSEEERKVLKFVNRFSTRRKNNIYKIDKKTLGKLDLILPDDKIVGEDIDVGTKVTNLTSEKRNVQVRMTLASIFYTGVVGKKVKEETMELTLEAGQEKEVLMSVSAEDYEQTMNPEANFKVTAVCCMTETKDMFVATDTFVLQKPALKFDVPEKIPSSTDTTATLTFKNTTDLKLHGGVFHLEGSYIVKTKTYNIRKIIHPDEVVSVEVALYPRRLGERYVMATFSSDELTGMEGEASIQVISKSDWEELEKAEKKKEDEEEVMETDAAVGDKDVDKAAEGADEGATGDDVDKAKVEKEEN